MGGKGRWSLRIGRRGMRSYSLYMYQLLNELFSVCVVEFVLECPKMRCENVPRYYYSILASYQIFFLTADSRRDEDGGSIESFTHFSYHLRMHKVA